MEASLNENKRPVWDDLREPNSYRTCIVSGQRKLKAEMLRFVIGPDNYAVLDVDEKLPGRGLWLSAERETLNIACNRDFFSKRARRRVSASIDLGQLAESLLTNKCIQLLQLARRSGILTVGSNEVSKNLCKGAKGLLVIAADGAPKSIRKVTNIARDLPIRSALNGNELGAVLGRKRLVNAFVEKGGLADRLARDLGRLSGLRKQSTVI